MLKLARLALDIVEDIARGRQGDISAYLPAINEIRTARETPPLLALRRREKARSKSGLWCSGGERYRTSP